MDCLFWLHLVLEKSLKGLYVKRGLGEPKRTHFLRYFVEIMNLRIEESSQKLIDHFDIISVPSRYPEDVIAWTNQYDSDRVKQYIEEVKQFQIWIRQQ